MVNVPIVIIKLIGEKDYSRVGQSGQPDGLICRCAVDYSQQFPTDKVKRDERILQKNRQVFQVWQDPDRTGWWILRRM